MGEPVPKETVDAWIETRKGFYYAMLPIEEERFAKMIPLLAAKDAWLFALQEEFMLIGPRGKITYPGMESSSNYQILMADFDAEKAVVDAWYKRERTRIAQDYRITT